MPRSCSPRPRRPRRTAATPRRRRSTGAASPPIPATRWPPSTAPTACAAEGRSAEAAHDYVRALKLDPEFVEAWFNLAGLAAERGHPEAARRHLIKALALDPGYADAVYNLAWLDYRGRPSSTTRAALVAALSRARPQLGMGAPRAARHPFRRPRARPSQRRLSVWPSATAFCSTDLPMPRSRCCSPMAPARRWIRPR